MDELVKKGKSNPTAANSSAPTPAIQIGRLVDFLCHWSYIQIDDPFL
ncbi:MAG: hypothetical protein V5A68_07325 [Candidatus Thermoplasmatota archaeon]